MSNIPKSDRRAGIPFTMEAFRKIKQDAYEHEERLQRIRDTIAEQVERARQLEKAKKFAHACWSFAFIVAACASIVSCVAYVMSGARETDRLNALMEQQETDAIRSRCLEMTRDPVNCDILIELRKLDKRLKGQQQDAAWQGVMQYQQGLTQGIIMGGGSK